MNLKQLKKVIFGNSFNFYIAIIGLIMAIASIFVLLSDKNLRGALILLSVGIGCILYSFRGE